ncbi:receptor-transporting protein 3 isoform X2 [Mesocricetus auratus]|uniref:Receptor-transporting protein 3 isoform X2 n=1 Tax=Mesocricetus auratus TaxID=10036 RepID=A0ABM2WYZ0_MESAU|nr:receptor-transporting protein 3 isoform X2 [Mesocricetus auratus]XP_040595895.1 receptor-transporting protein 3 isoform X2 [Mesocricetus auratus]XP_040595896.1 receptor-transporting protein 3 isoform X2 [Mesocricetus auratus]XP_040595897.1 receptor-transporting protein 3 isoform X2 [Mesocricetus auratus]
MMEEDDVEVWQQVFQELMQEVKPWHKWTLKPDKDLLPDVLKPGWTQYQQKTFARFHCSSCARSWASGCVLMVFHMHWCEKKSKGEVKMRAFAQRCNKCPEPPFAAPEFTWDNISRILNNLLFRILKKCYREGIEQTGEIPLLGDTSLEGPHDSNNCEACLQGFCAQRGVGPASKPPAGSLSPSSSKSTREPKVTASGSNVPCSQPSSKVAKPQTSKVDPKVSDPTKAAPKVSHTSNPSTTILTTQQLSPVSSPTPRGVTQMPSPIKSSRTADLGSKTQKASSRSSSFVPSPYSYAPPTYSYVLPPSSSYVPPPSSSYVPPPSSSYVPPPSASYVPPTSSSYVPPTPSFVGSTVSSYVAPAPSRVVANSWRPPTQSTYQIERSSHIHSSSESSRCGACCEGFCRCCGACCEDFCGACCEGFCECMSHRPCQRLAFLIVVAVVVTLYIKYGM